MKTKLFRSAERQFTKKLRDNALCYWQEVTPLLSSRNEVWTAADQNGPDQSSVQLRGAGVEEDSNAARLRFQSYRSFSYRRDIIIIQ